MRGEGFPFCPPVQQKGWHAHSELSAIISHHGKLLSERERPARRLFDIAGLALREKGLKYT